jgi:hypothetical protein
MRMHFFSDAGCGSRMSRLTPERSAAVSGQQTRLNLGGARLRNFLNWRSKRCALTRRWIRYADRPPSRCPRTCHPHQPLTSQPFDALDARSGQDFSLFTDHPPHLHLSPRPRTQIIQPQSADTNPDQTQGGVTDRSSHPAHLPVLSFIKNDA